MKKSLFISITITILIYHIGSIDAFGQSKDTSGPSLRISPSLLYIKAKPASQVSTSIIIENLSASQQEVQIVLKPFNPSKEANGQISYDNQILSTDTAAYPLFKQVSLFDQGQKIEALTLAPYEKVKTEIKIDLKNQAEKDYYFSIILMSNPQETRLNQQSQKKSAYAMSTLRLGIANNIVLSVSQQNISEGYIQEFSTNTFIEHGPAVFTIKYQNTGTQAQELHGQIALINMFGQTIGNINIPSSLVLEDSTRLLSNQTDALQNKTKVLWKENILFGLYTANLKLERPGADSIQRSVRFFAFPVEAVAYLIGIIFVFILIQDRLKKRKK